MKKLPRQVYTDEFRRQAVEMIQREGVSLAEAARRLSTSPKTLLNWVRRAKTGNLPEAGIGAPRHVMDGGGGRVVAAAAGERRVADGARHPKKVGGVLRQRVAARYALIKGLRREYPLAVLCRVLDVSRSGYSAWLTREPSPRARARARLEVAVRAAHDRTRATYGAQRLQKELAADGFFVSLSTLRRVRRALGLRCVQRRRFRVVTTNSRHELAVAPNLLGQNFKAERPDRVWTADIAYVATAEGWLYVAAIKDLFAGEIVGRSFGERMTTELVVRAFAQAIAARRPAPGLIHHSDRGSQYCSHEYQALLARHEIQVSMSRKGNCYDNASVESFWGHAED